VRCGLLSLLLPGSWMRRLAAAVEPATAPSTAIDAKPEIAIRRLLFVQSAFECAFAAAVSAFQNMISFPLVAAIRCR
jgi:hypothetical protein